MTAYLVNLKFLSTSYFINCSIWIAQSLLTGSLTIIQTKRDLNHSSSGLLSISSIILWSSSSSISKYLIQSLFLIYCYYVEHIQSTRHPNAHTSAFGQLSVLLNCSGALKIALPQLVTVGLGVLKRLADSPKSRNTRKK